MITSLTSIDQFLQHGINIVATNPFLDHVMAAATNFSAWRPIIIVLLILGFVFGTFRLRMMFLCLALTLVVTDGLVVRNLKHLVGRPRPFQSEGMVRQVRLIPASPQLTTILKTPEVSFSKPPAVGVPLQGVSFPSSHAANIMALATVLSLFYRRWRWFFYSIALIVVYSRIYIGVHWPSDVAAGCCIGIGVAFMVTFIFEKIWIRFGSHMAPELAKRYPKLLMRHQS